MHISMHEKYVDNASILLFPKLSENLARLDDPWIGQLVEDIVVFAAHLYYL